MEIDCVISRLCDVCPVLFCSTYLQGLLGAPASKVESVQLVKLDNVIFFSLDFKLAGGLEGGSANREDPYRLRFYLKSCEKRRTYHEGFTTGPISEKYLLLSLKHNSCIYLYCASV